MTLKDETIETTTSDSSPKSSPEAEVEMAANNAQWQKKIGKMDQQMTAMQNSMNMMLTFMTFVS